MLHLVPLNWNQLSLLKVSTKYWKDISYMIRNKLSLGSEEKLKQNKQKSNFHSAEVD